MNTSISITISFIIGGLLLTSIITMNANVIENSGETVLNMSAKKMIETATKVMTRDFLRVGYNTGDDPKKAIKQAVSNSNPQRHQKMVFTADMDNDYTESPVKISWEAKPNQKVITTKNPNDYKLTRTVYSGPEQGTTTFTVTNFTLTFLDEDGNVTTNKTKIKSVRIFMECEAPAKYGNKEGYEKSVWDKTFTPPNLNLQAYN